VRWSPRGGYLATFAPRGLRLWSGSKFEYGHGFAHTGVREVRCGRETDPEGGREMYMQQAVRLLAATLTAATRLVPTAVLHGSRALGQRRASHPCGSPARAA